jgi:hypothetical protein
MNIAKQQPGALKWDPLGQQVGLKGLLDIHKSKVYGFAYIQRGTSSEIMIVHNIVGKLDHKLSFSSTLVMSSGKAFAELIEDSTKWSTREEKFVGLLKTAFRRFRILTVRKEPLEILLQKEVFLMGLPEKEFINTALVLKRNDAVLTWAKYQGDVEEFEKSLEKYKTAKSRFTPELAKRFAPPVEPGYIPGNYGGYSLEQLSVFRNKFNERLLEAGPQPEMPYDPVFNAGKYRDGSEQFAVTDAVLSLFNPVTVQEAIIDLASKAGKSTSSFATGSSYDVSEFKGLTANQFLTGTVQGSAVSINAKPTFALPPRTKQPQGATASTEVAAETNFPVFTEDWNEMDEMPTHDKDITPDIQMHEFFRKEGFDDDDIVFYSGVIKDKDIDQVFSTNGETINVVPPGIDEMPEGKEKSERISLYRKSLKKAYNFFYPKGKENIKKKE